ncbi:MAG: hypothetical protein Ct9H300mP11_17260 [Chloroflexota bacterium]|nr:MAG: hypothetical protein Ct9H300mP11_17260 [Chloroflexota bacterium]
MKAAVLHEVNQPLQMEEIDVALPGPRERSWCAKRALWCLS